MPDRAIIFQTELCRNWEEKGSCRYGSRCVDLFRLDTTILAAYQLPLYTDVSTPMEGTRLAMSPVILK